MSGLNSKHMVYIRHLHLSISTSLNRFIPAASFGELASHFPLATFMPGRVVELRVHGRGSYESILNAMATILYDIDHHQAGFCFTRVHSSWRVCMLCG